MFKIERSLRLPKFHEDVPIVLGNGEAFHFRPPRFVHYPRFDDDGNAVTCLGLNYGPEWEEQFGKSVEADLAKQDIFPYICWFADRMLRRNYKEEIRRYYSVLIFHTKDEPDSLRRLMQIYDLARGVDPKEITSDGSGQPSAPTA